jgi:hypothetical protein
MAELFAGGSFIALILFAVLAILMPVCVYTAQKYAYRCYKELVKVNQALERIEALAEPKKE